jgi:hypothetical protein
MLFFLIKKLILGVKMIKYFKYFIIFLAISFIIITCKKNNINSNSTNNSNLEENAYLGIFYPENLEIISEKNSKFENWQDIPKIIRLKIEKDNGIYKYYVNLFGDKFVNIDNSKILLDEFATSYNIGFGYRNFYFSRTNNGYSLHSSLKQTLYEFDENGKYNEETEKEHIFEFKLRLMK